jgi:hypothetical protein
VVPIDAGNFNGIKNQFAASLHAAMSASRSVPPANSGFGKLFNHRGKLGFHRVARHSSADCFPSNFN